MNQNQTGLKNNQEQEFHVSCAQEKAELKRLAEISDDVQFMNELHTYYRKNMGLQILVRFGDKYSLGNGIFLSLDDEKNFLLLDSNAKKEVRTSVGQIFRVCDKGILENDSDVSTSAVIVVGDESLVCIDLSSNVLNRILKKHF